MTQNKTLAKAESLFRRGMGLHSEGFDRPDEYTPEQIGWDAAKEIDRIKAEYLDKCRQEFGVSKMTYRITRIKTAPDKKDRQGYYLEAMNGLEALTKFHNQFPEFVGEELELEEWI